MYSDSVEFNLLQSSFPVLALQMSSYSDVVDSETR